MMTHLDDDTFGQGLGCVDFSNASSAVLQLPLLDLGLDVLNHKKHILE